MVCDLQGTIGGDTIIKVSTKMWRYDDGNYYPDPFIVGMAGLLDETMEVADYFRNPQDYMRPPRVKNVTGLVLTAAGGLYYFSDYRKWITLKGKKYHAIGSGASAALGALTVGASPADAVKAAITIDPYSGQGIKTLKI